MSYSGEGLLTAAMAGKNALCERVGDLQNVQAVFLAQDGSIVQWKARKGVRTPSPEQMDNIVVQRQMILALARAHEGVLGRLHYNLSMYDDSDILLFDAPAGKRSMLMVMVKNPTRLTASCTRSAMR